MSPRVLNVLVPLLRQTPSSHASSGSAGSGASGVRPPRADRGPAVAAFARFRVDGALPSEAAVATSGCAPSTGSPESPTVPAVPNGSAAVGSSPVVRPSAVPGAAPPADSSPPRCHSRGRHPTDPRRRVLRGGAPWLVRRQGGRTGRGTRRRRVRSGHVDDAFVVPGHLGRHGRVDLDGSFDRGRAALVEPRRAFQSWVWFRRAGAHRHSASQAATSAVLRHNGSQSVAGCRPTARGTCRVAGAGRTGERGTTGAGAPSRRPSG